MKLSPLEAALSPAHPDGSAIHVGVIDFLLSPAGQAAARELEGANLEAAQTLPLLDALRRRFAAAEAGALLALARLRRQARAKFDDADRLFFVPEALEQATAGPIAAHRADWIHRHAPPGSLLDLGCGVGGDTLALARLRPVIAYERDPLRLRLAQANAQSRGLANTVRFVEADWTAALTHGDLADGAAAFVDPARRVAGRRLFSLHTMQPPLAPILALQRQIAAVGVKVAPGVDERELPPDCGIEFVSHHGVCKEAVLWFGPLAAPPTATSGRRWASVYVAGQWHQTTASLQPPPLGPLRAGQYLHEPDPALIRAGALAELCQTLDAHLFDPQIAYLVSPTCHTSPLTQTFVLLEVHRFSLRLLNQRLTALGIGTPELKKRGFPIEPETLRSRLRPVAGGAAGVVILTRQGDDHLMLIGRRMRTPPADRPTLAAAARS